MGRWQRTPHRFAKTLVALGLPLEQSGDYYGYSLALGSADVTLLSLTNAYRALANNGVAAPTFDLPRRMPSAALAQQRVFSADASYIITTVLSDNNARTLQLLAQTETQMRAAMESASRLALDANSATFLKLARDADAKQVADGVGMLVEQAAEAFAWWRGVRPDTRALIATLTVPLA